mmetsp:Transcript_73284/g.118220  ORF Transcript_73284/g.118220 Transcript_73284/m.118220 type:complete len:87 (-) Transcript_73284:693-953(-)
MSSLGQGDIMLVQSSWDFTNALAALSQFQFLIQMKCIPVLINLQPLPNQVSTWCPHLMLQPWQSAALCLRAKVPGLLMVRWMTAPC